MHIVLFEPEIPANTGNISRTCAVTGIALHLIEPLGFSIADRMLKRAGLDYWDKLDLTVHRDFASFYQNIRKGALYMFTTKADRRYTDVQFRSDDYLLFGPETRGLPPAILEGGFGQALRIPLGPAVRSLNLSNAVAVAAFEALRQQGFPGLV